MKANELRTKSLQELQELLKTEREQLRARSFDLAAGKLKNIRDVRMVRRHIAQILTVLKEKV
ncbi:50S ribosomal protein L29 [Candidatus Azambacteria bacterium]|nr:50S ribosomal protein L29 [Candidatus Azambacteria bacterium]MBI2587763.1 50S ribosomal protein L29 [Candidatus Azambacteria bacterium]